MLSQPLDHGHVVGRAQKQVRAPRDLRTHAVDGGQILFSCLHEHSGARIRSSQQLGNGLAHVADTQAEQRAREGARPAFVDGGHQLLCHGRPQPNGVAVLVHAAHVQKRKLHLVQRVVIRNVGQAPALHQARHDFLAHAVDVHGSAARPMEQTLQSLRRTIDGNAAEIHLALFANDRACATRTRGRHAPRCSVGRAKGQHGTQNLGDDVARLADDNGVAHAHVLALDLVFVMKRGPGNGRAGHDHRVQLGHRRKLAGTPHLHGDVAQKRGLFLGRELERDGPPRRARRVAHRFLLREGVHLDHHAVDLVRQLLAPFERAFAERMHRLGRLAQLDVGIDVEAGFAQPLQQLPLPCGVQSALVGNRVDERRQIAMSRDGGVFLAQAAGSGVAGIGERLLAVSLGRRVQGLETRLRHVHLSAQLDGAVRIDQARHALLAQAQRHVLDRAHVGGHVLARRAVAARRRAHQTRAFVRKGYGRSVDLELAAHRHHAAERFDHAVEPRVQLFQIHGVVKRVHPARMAHGSELVAHVAAHALRGACGVDQVRMRRLQLAQFAHERVERRIGYLGRIVGVV